jgi:hypothetical protein
MKKINEEIFKPTLKKPVNKQSQNFEKTFKKTMTQFNPTMKLNETDGLLTEKEQSLKKKIFSLSKMEALVFSDPKLSAVYEEMAENGEEKYGYHYNETIMNMIFNDYVLNSPKYLQKYKMAIPKEKKRRDQSGINQLKKAGEEKMAQSGLPKADEKKPEKDLAPSGLPKPDVVEAGEPLTKVQFLVNERDPENPNVFAYFPEENYDVAGKYKTGYSHIGQHSAVDPQYAAESRPATPEEYTDLKAELEGVGYNLEVLNQTNETTGSGSSGAYVGAAAWKKNGGDLAETTSASSAGGAAGYVGYAGPAAWGSGDLMKAGGKSKVMRKPMIPGGTFIQESNYLIDSSGFEKFIEMLNEDIDLSYQTELGKEYKQTHTGSNHGLGVRELPTSPRRDALKSDIDANTELYVGQDVDRMPNKDVDILHVDMTTPNSMFPDPKNPVLRNDGIAGDVKEQTVDRASANNKIIDKTAAFTSDVVKNWSNKDAQIELNTINSRKMDTPNLNEKSKSKSQQRFMGMVHATHKGELSPDEVGGDVAKAAASMTKKDVEDFATTKHKGLPEKIDEEYRVSNPQPLKQVGWLPIRTYKTGGAAVFENDDYGKTQGASYIVGSPYEMEYVVKPYKLGDNENNYLIQQNPKFWIRHIKIDDNTNKIYYLDDDGKYKFFANNQGIEINPNKNWSHNIDTERFLQKIEDMKKQGATFKLDDSDVNEDTQTMIQNNGTSMSNKATPAGDQSSNMDTGARSSGGMSEALELESANKLLEELNNELEAFSIHQNKLKKMSEDRKPSSLVMKDRLGNDNEKNFKSDLQQSGTKEIIDVEKELQYKDQQTNIGDDPQKLAQDIEKAEIKATDAKGEEHLKNVGDSPNDKGDEIPKRNLKDEEQHEVDMYRNGQHSWVYDNEPDKRFEDRMRADMGDDIYKIRQEQMKFRAKAPMYNKDTQPVGDGIDKVQFDKEKSGWNDREGLMETMVTGRFVDALGKKFIMDFRLNEAKVVKESKEVESMFELDFTGFGNKYVNRTQDNKVIVNETVENVLSESKYFTDGKSIFVMKNPVQKINESEQKVQKPVVNEQVNKMKHLLGYKPNQFVDTKNVRKNRGF